MYIYLKENSKMKDWNSAKFDWNWRKDLVTTILSENTTAEEKLQKLSVNPYTNLNIIDYLLEYGKNLEYFFNPTVLEDEYGDDFYDFFNESYYDLNFSAINDLIVDEVNEINEGLLKKIKHALYMREKLNALYDRKVEVETSIEDEEDEEEIIEGLCLFYDEVCEFLAQCADYEYSNNKTLRKQYLKQQKGIFTMKVPFVSVNVSTKLREHIAKVETTKSEPVEKEEKKTATKKGDTVIKTDGKKQKKKKEDKENEKKISDGISFIPNNSMGPCKTIFTNVWLILLKYLMVGLCVLLYFFVFPEFTYIDKIVKPVIWGFATVLLAVDVLTSIFNNNVSVLDDFSINPNYVLTLSSYSSAMKFVRKVKGASVKNALREVIAPIIAGVITYAVTSLIALILSITFTEVAFLYNFAIFDLILAVPLYLIVLLITYIWILFKHVGKKELAIFKIEYKSNTLFWRKCPKCGGLLIHEILEEREEKEMVSRGSSTWVNDTTTYWVTDSSTPSYKLNGDRVTVSSGGHYETSAPTYNTTYFAKLKETCRQCGSVEIIERNITEARRKRAIYLSSELAEERNKPQIEERRKQQAKKEADGKIKKI